MRQQRKPAKNNRNHIFQQVIAATAKSLKFSLDPDAIQWGDWWFNHNALSTKNADLWLGIAVNWHCLSRDSAWMYRASRE